jgi:hypothetical protein
MKETLDGLSKTGLLGSVGSFLVATFDKNIAEVNKAGLLDTLVTRYEVRADGKSINLTQGTESDRYPSLEKVVLSAENASELQAALDLTRDQGRGGALLLRGITRCGKTFTTKAIAHELAKNSPNKKAQYWFVSNSVMEKSLGDENRFFGKLLGEDPTIDKLEKIIAHAVMSRGEKDDIPIVIVVDEAQDFVSSKNNSKNDPLQNSALVEGLKRLISEHLNTPKCKNILLAFTANSSADQLASPMQERMAADLFYDQPKAAERAAMIRLILADEFEKKGETLDIKLSDIKDSDLDKLAAIGTVNLLTKFGSKSETHAFEEAVRAGFGGNVEELRSRPMFNHLQIEKIVRSSVVNYIKSGMGGTKKLIDIIEDALKKKLDSVLANRSTWKKDLQFYFAG